MKLCSYMLADRVELVRQSFGVELIDYDRPNASGILFTSGCGIGLGIMDACPYLRWFCDMDTYRLTPFDWEAIAIVLSAGEPDLIALAGWFTLDKPENFYRLASGILPNVPYFIYEGGQSLDLKKFLGLLEGYCRIRRPLPAANARE